jgi:hypothetical protein
MSSAKITLQLDQIRTDGGTQPRAHLDEPTIKEYADDMRGGAKFPPVVVFYDGDHYWLVDGFHRVAAAKRVPRTEISAEVHQGSRRDAVLYSVGVNATHGLRRTNDDKRRTVLVLLNDPEWSQWSDREIARRCKVTHPFVGALRKASLETITSENETRAFISKHGTAARMDVTAIQNANQARAGVDSADEQSDLADGIAPTTDGDAETPAASASPQVASGEGAGEESAPVISDASRQFADDAKLSGDILTALTSGPKSLIELSKATEVHPTRLLDVLPRLVTNRLLTKTNVPGGQARYALPESSTQAGTSPVGKNGPGIPDTHNPEREAAIAAAARLERAALDVIGAVEHFTQIKGIRALHALDADRLASVEQLLNQVVTQAAAASEHAVDLTTKVRTMAATGQPYDDVSTH